jgi:hypothetical protein
MKRLLIVAAVLALSAMPSFAALQYDFVQKNVTEDPLNPQTDLKGMATIDGQRSRIDFVSGDVYPPGTYVISRDGARQLVFVDPAHNSYMEYNTAGAVSSIGASNIKISNLKDKLEIPGDSQIIAGIKGDHYRLTLTYDITITLRGLPLTQGVSTTIDAWTTTQFGDVGPTALNSAMQTGNAEIDKLLEREASGIKGFPLRQLVTIRTTNENAAIKSELKVPAVRTVTHETWVTAVREVPPNAAFFNVPSAFRRADVPELPKGSNTQTITFDAPSGQ